MLSNYFTNLFDYDSMVNSKRRETVRRRADQYGLYNLFEIS